MTLRLELGAILAPMLALPILVRQLRVLRVEDRRKQLFGPEPGLERAIEDGLDVFVRMGKVLNQQVAVDAIKWFGR